MHRYKKTRNSCFSISIQHSYKMGLEGVLDSLPLPSVLENNFSPFPSPCCACHAVYFDHATQSHHRDQGPSYAWHGTFASEVTQITVNTATRSCSVTGKCHEIASLLRKSLLLLKHQQSYSV